jgi:hypothetical protein
MRAEGCGCRQQCRRHRPDALVGPGTNLEDTSPLSPTLRPAAGSCALKSSEWTDVWSKLPLDKIPLANSESVPFCAFQVIFDLKILLHPS